MNAVWENLDTFLDTNDFAIQTTLRLQSGSWACGTQCFTEKRAVSVRRSGLPYIPKVPGKCRSL